MNLLIRLVEFLPLALVLGTALAALRHEEMGAIQKGALRNTARIVLWLVLGCALLQCLLWVVQD